MTDFKIKEGPYYIDFLGEERPVIHIKIDDIYCKHERDYGQYRNNYRNQLRGMLADPQNLEYKRNTALCDTLKTQEWVYPIGLLEFSSPSPQGPDGYICFDGHHRIKAHLTMGYDTIPGIIYKSDEEAAEAKASPYLGDQHETTMKDFEKNEETN